MKIGIIKKIGQTVDVNVDTSVWSLLLRRNLVEKTNKYVKTLRHYLESHYCIHLPGFVLSEILDGTKTSKQFDLLNDYFEAFPLLTMERTDFTQAARLKNKCRSKGIQAGTVDFLIAAMAINRNVPLLTADKDFQYIAEHCDLILAETDR